MRRFMTIALALCTVSAGLLAAQTGKPAEEDAIVKADRALAAAYAKGDTAAIKKMLDEEFTWIDTDGIMYERADTFPRKPQTAGPYDCRHGDHRTQIWQGGLDPGQRGPQVCRALLGAAS